MFRLVFFLALLVILLSPPLEAQNQGFLFLRVESQETQKVLLQLAIQPGDFFYYQYIHSSDHTPVRDTFRAEKGGKMTLIEEAYLWYGAGLEFRDHGEGKVIYDGPWTRVHLNRAFSQLPIRVGRVAQQILLIHGHSYHLGDLGKPGDCLTLSLAP